MNIKTFKVHNITRFEQVSSVTVFGLGGIGLAVIIGAVQAGTKEESE